jgi:Rrf2 family protein
MGELERANLVRSVPGRRGGFVLGRDASSISLADVYRAVEDETVFRMHKLDPNSECPIAAQMGKILSAPLKAAEAAMTASLSRTSLSDVVGAVI